MYRERDIDVSIYRERDIDTCTTPALGGPEAAAHR